MRHPLFGSSFVVAIGVLAPPAASQTGFELWKYSGVGTEVSNAGDIDGDGLDDVILSDAGRTIVQVVSGATRREVHRITQATAQSFGRSLSGVGDVDRDGVPDFAVGAPLADFGGRNTGRVYVYSGADGSELYTFDGDAPNDDLGTSVAGAGDVDGDGHADVIAGASQGGARGYVRIFSGSNGAEIRTHLGLSTSGGFGSSVDGGGDVDGDGTPDVIVGEPGDDKVARGAGAAHVFSGATGARIFSRYGSRMDDSFGHRVSNGEDMDGDGRSEVVVLARQNNQFGPSYVRVFRGTGTLLHSFAAAGLDDQFYSVDGGRDIDGDAVPDIAIGARQGMQIGPGYVLAQSGASGALIFQRAGSAGLFFGQTVALADVETHGHAEVLVESPGTREVIALTTVLPNVCQMDLGFQGPGGAAATLCGAGLTLGKTSSYDVGGAPAFAPGVFMVSQSGFANVPIFGGTLVSFGGFVLSLPVGADGAGALTLTVPGSVVPADLVLQSAFVDLALPANFGFTNAILGRFGQ